MANKGDTLMPFKKVVHPVNTSDGPAFAKIEWSGEKLSISGVIGPKRNGDAEGSCGQIDRSLREHYPERTYAPGWDADLFTRFLDTWDKWHLNDMRPGCEHQRAEGWGERPIDPSKPLDAYGRHFEGQRQPSWNMLGWVTRAEHPEGLLSHPCPTCGYKYGSSWLTEAVPDDVVTFLRSLPDTDVTPAWV